MRNATDLLGLACGRPNCGAQRCFYCGSPAGEIPLVLSSSFTDWWNVAFPSSDVICNGCDLALDEKLAMPDRDKPQTRRNWSWLLTAAQATPLSDIASIRSACLSPPAFPWALAIAVSGQKHVIFRTPANLGGTSFAVGFETIVVNYTVHGLSARIELAKKIAAASGKPALTAPLDTSLAMRLLATCTELEINDWFSRAAEPINQLAAFLCPPKDQCQNEYTASA